jgi:hypothetical protein
MYTLKELEDAVSKYFGDMSRSKSETKSGLLALAEHCETLADTINEEED